jgi:DinB family protein
MTSADDLKHTVDSATPRLIALATTSATPLAPGKWSPQEIIGHLIDSASNNHQRFVRAQLQDELVFPGYAQDDWVRIGGYADAPWEELITLWRTFNHQIARVMERVPDEVRTRPRAIHNFESLGVRLQPGQSARLDDVMTGYVAHLKHHLSQVFGEQSTGY